MPSAIVLLLLLLLLPGCVVLGVAAHKLAPPETIQPKYLGLQNETVGIMVWADRGIRIDWPTLQLDLANSVQNKLKDAQAKNDKNARPLAGMSFPYPPASFVRYQKDHPEIEAMPIAEVAPRLGVNRLIYVEVEDFATRSNAAVELYRGLAQANVKVYEIADDRAKLAYEWSRVQATFPPKALQEGVPNLGDWRTYVGTTDAFGTEIARLFHPYQVEE